MIEKHKRGNGGSYIQAVVDTSSPMVMDKIRSQMEEHKLGNQKRKEDQILKENLRIFRKINDTIENEKIPFLQQFGPKSLNFINKKERIKRIRQENQMLASRILKAKAYINRDDILLHQNKAEKHKKMLMDNSPSSAKLDPLVSKHIQSKGNLHSLLMRSASRNSYNPSSLSYATSVVPKLESPSNLGRVKQNYSLASNSPRENLQLPNIFNLQTVKEANFESTHYNLGGLYSQNPDYDPLSFSNIQPKSNYFSQTMEQDMSSQSKQTRFKQIKASLGGRSDSINGDGVNKLTLNKIKQNHIFIQIHSSRNFIGEYVPAHQRSKIHKYNKQIERNSSFLKGYSGSFLNTSDIIQVKVRQPSREEFISQQMIYELNKSQLNTEDQQNDNQMRYILQNQGEL